MMLNWAIGVGLVSGAGLIVLATVRSSNGDVDGYLVTSACGLTLLVATWFLIDAAARKEK